MSNQIWEKNLHAMEKWYPAFVERLLEQKDRKEELSVHTEVSMDQEKIFRVQKGDDLRYLGGKRNAKEPVKIWLERLGKLHKHAPVFLFGVGSGAYLKALIQHTDKEVNIVVYEPSVTIFRTMLEEIDLAEEIANRPIAFVVEGINQNEFAPVMHRVLAVESLGFLKEEIHPGYRGLFGDQIVSYVRQLQRRAESMQVSYNSGMLFSKDIAQNVLGNAKFVCDGYNTKKLSDAVPHNGPAILVAAGPSLNKNIMELKKAKNKAFILAVDTAIKPLLKAGIVPDAFFTIDPHKLLELVEIEGADQIPVIAPTSARHALIKRQKGKKIFYFDGYAIPLHIYHINKKEFWNVSTGGSVACNGFSLLYKMGFNTIILVGQDLAYTDHKSHADGTFEEVMPQENTDHMIMVKGNYEDKVPTLPNLRMYLDWFHRYVTGAKERYNIRVINATEGGAWIDGTELMPLKDAVAQTCQSADRIDFSDCIAHMESAFTAEEQEKAQAYLQTIPDQYDELMKIAKKLKSAYQKLAQMSHSEKIEKSALQKQLQKIKKLSRQCHQKEAYQLIEATVPGAEFIIRSEFYYENNTLAEETNEIARKGIKYSDLLEQCSALLKEMSAEILLPKEATSILETALP